MSQQVQLQLPDQLVQYLNELAERTQQPFEAVAVAAMQSGISNQDLLIETPEEIMAAYSDDELWAVVDQRLTKAENRRYHRLVNKGNEGKLSPADEAALHGLLHKINFQMLERTKALVILQGRGHTIKNGYLKTGKR